MSRAGTQRAQGLANIVITEGLMPDPKHQSKEGTRKKRLSSLLLSPELQPVPPIS